MNIHNKHGINWAKLNIHVDTVIYINMYLSDIICVCVYILEKAMAPHSSALAWKIPWMEEPGGLQSMGSLRVGHD